jgi:hypothetical protein
MNKTGTMSRTMSAYHNLPEDDVQRALAELHRGWEALRQLRNQTPLDSPVGAQAAHVMKALDGMAETLTYDRTYFHAR